MDYKAIIEAFYGLLGDFLKLIGLGDKLAEIDDKINNAKGEIDSILGIK